MKKGTDKEKGREQANEKERERGSILALSCLITVIP